MIEIGSFAIAAFTTTRERGEKTEKERVRERGRESERERKKKALHFDIASSEVHLLRMRPFCRAPEGQKTL